MGFSDWYEKEHRAGTEVQQQLFHVVRRRMATTIDGRGTSPLASPPFAGQG